MSSSGIGLDWIFECKPCGFGLQTDIYSDFEAIGGTSRTRLSINTNNPSYRVFIRRQGCKTLSPLTRGF